MKKMFGKILFVNHNFYIKNKKNKFTKAENVKMMKMENLEKFEFFIYRDKLGLWSVYESISGCRVSKFNKDLKKVIREAKKNLKAFTDGSFETKIFQFLKTNRLSPRYVYIVNPSNRR